MRSRNHHEFPRHQLLEKSVVVVSQPLSEMFRVPATPETDLEIAQETMTDGGAAKIKAETETETETGSGTVRLNAHVTVTVNVIVTRIGIAIARESAVIHARWKEGKEVDPGAESAAVLLLVDLLMRTTIDREKREPEIAVPLDVGMIGTDESEAVQGIERSGVEADVVSVADRVFATIATGVTERIAAKDRVRLANVLRERTEADRVCAPKSETEAAPPEEPAARSPRNPRRPVIAQRRLVIVAAGHDHVLPLRPSKMSSRSGKWARSRNASKKPRPI